jgi:hypothetical protein
MGMTPKKIELHIEELALHGFAPGDRYRIAEAVERELTQLFTEQGLPPSLMKGGSIDKLDGGAFNMAPSSKAGVIGVQVARAVYGGLRR